MVLWPQYSKDFLDTTQKHKSETKRKRENVKLDIIKMNFSADKNIP